MPQILHISLRLGSLAGRAGTILRDVTGGAALNGRDRFTVFPGVITVKLLPIPVLMVINDPGELIDLELLIPG